MCTRRPRPKHRPPRLWMRAYYYDPKLFERTFVGLILFFILYYFWD